MDEHIKFVHTPQEAPAPVFNMGATTVLAVGAGLLLVALIAGFATKSGDNPTIAILLMIIGAGLAVFGSIGLVRKPYLTPPAPPAPKLEPGLNGQLRAATGTRDLDSRIIKLAGLIEYVLTETSTLETKGSLGEMVQVCEELQREKLIPDVNFALGVRNSIAHPSRGTSPTNEEKKRAAEYLGAAATLLVRSNPYLFM